nr:hypothetical protein [Streptomyces xanthophaeus]
MFTSAGRGGRVLIQTRRGALVQGAFPGLVAATEAQLPHGLVLDGELVAWDTAAGRLSFEELQRRAASRGRTDTALAANTPAFFRLRHPPGRWPRAAVPVLLGAPPTPGGSVRRPRTDCPVDPVPHDH